LDYSGFTPFWEAAQTLDALIFVHPNQVVGAERMKDYNLANLIGNPTDFTRFCETNLRRCIGVLSSA
jgi:aminocarboxymuconate-semialdehyde decarboxylase